jgi:hypothetical protein
MVATNVDDDALTRQTREGFDRCRRDGAVTHDTRKAAETSYDLGP